MTAKFTASSDGSKVLIGNAAEDALEIDATAKTVKALSPYQLDADNAIGVGQTWQDVKASRTVSVTYTNSTSKPIQLSIVPILAPAGNDAVALSVGGVEVSRNYCNVPASTNITPQIAAIVPVGATYSLDVVSGAPTLGTWAELR